MIYVLLVLLIHFDTYSILFGTHTLSDGLSRVLQLSLHLSKLTINGSNTILNYTDQNLN